MITLACVVLATLLSGCGGGPPKELNGLWSIGPAACAAGLGVTFKGDAVWARYEKDEFLLMDAPRYVVTPTAGGSLVRIDYKLPSAPGGVSGALGRGVIEIELATASGRLTPLRSRYVDLRTGSARVPLRAGGLERALSLAHCPKHPHADPDED